MKRTLNDFAWQPPGVGDEAKALGIYGVA